MEQRLNVKHPLKVLVITHADSNAELVLRELEGASYEVTSKCVHTRSSLTEALDSERWELVLCDHDTPELDALTVIADVRGRGADLPVIVVSGRVGEERAVECMRAGAQDFVLKDGLARLIPAVARALHDVRRRSDERSSIEQLDRAEETLARTEKLRLLGQMAGGIAHDLKNLFNPLSLYLDLADRALGRGDLDRARSSIGELKHVVELGVDTIDRLRVFSQPAQDLPFTEISLDAVTQEAVALARARLRPTFPRPTEIRVELGAPPAILGDPSDLVSAVLHLVNNAVEAMPDGGVVVVRTGQDADRSWVEVRDTGPGISAEIQEKIYEPFFSTKDEPGTGLGLSIVRGAMLRHDGTNSRRTPLGRGNQDHRARRVARLARRLPVRISAM